MFSYLFLNLLFLSVLGLSLRRYARRLTPRTIAAGLGWMALATVLFDNLIIGLGVVNYDESKIMGLRLGLAPIEDFAYTFASAIVIPAVYLWLGRKNTDG